MPWKVSKSDQCPADKPWAMMRSDTGEKRACHATKEMAMKQMALLYMKQKKGEIAAEQDEFDFSDPEVWAYVMQEVSTIS